MFSTLETPRMSLTVRATAVVIAAALLIAPSGSVADQGQEKKPDAPAVTRKEDGKVPTGKELEKDKKKLEQQPGKPNAPVFTKAEANAELASCLRGPTLTTSRRHP